MPRARQKTDSPLATNSKSKTIRALSAVRATGDDDAHGEHCEPRNGGGRAEPGQARGAGHAWGGGESGRTPGRG